MRCFEVDVNGERYCLAGVGDVGALSAFVTYVGVRGPDGATVAGPTYLSVSRSAWLTRSDRIRACR